MKNGCKMIIGNECELGSRKCGKAGAFAHMPTNFTILVKINSITNHLIKRVRTGIDIKKLNINGLKKRSY